MLLELLVDIIMLHSPLLVDFPLLRWKIITKIDIHDRQDNHDRYQCNIMALNPSNTIYLKNLYYMKHYYFSSQDFVNYNQ